jgi:hypothetical protein
MASSSWCHWSYSIGWCCPPYGVQSRLNAVLTGQGRHSAERAASSVATQRRQAAVDVVRSRACSLVLTRYSRDRVGLLQSGQRLRSLHNSAAVNGFRVKLDSHWLCRLFRPSVMCSKRQKCHFLSGESNSTLQGLSSYFGIVQDNGVILHRKFSFTDR